MSITKSKRIPLNVIWRILQYRGRRDLLIFTGLPFDTEGLPHCAEVYADKNWDDVPEAIQEDVYNKLVTL